MFIKVPLCKQAPLFGVNRYTVYLWRCSGLSCRVNLRCLFIPTMNISLDCYAEHNLADSICQQPIPWCLHTPFEATLYYSLSHTNEKSEQFSSSIRFWSIRPFLLGFWLICSTTCVVNTMRFALHHSHVWLSSRSPERFVQFLDIWSSVLENESQNFIKELYNKLI